MPDLPLRRVLTLVLLSLTVAAGPGPAAPPASPPPTTHGLDLAAIDRSILPGNDFFGYANGNWLKTTEIPPDKSRWGVFDALAEESLRRTRGLVEEASRSSAATGSSERKVGDYYAAFMDEAAVEAKGLAPLQPGLDQIAALKDKKALAHILGDGLRNDVDPLNNTNFQTDRLFGLWISPDFNAPDHNIPYLLQGGLGLPDREYYLNPSARMADLRSRYRTHIAAIFKLAGISGGEAKASRILALETKMARVHATRAESLEVRRANNPWKREEFSKRAPGLDWATYFEAAGLNAQPVIIVWHPRATSGLAALVRSEPLATWKEWLTFHLIDRRSNLLPKAFVDERFAFYGKTLTGAPELPERWKRGTFATSLALGDVVGQLYVKRYFPPEAKAQVQEMVKNIVAAFRERIDKLDWMAAETKARAKEKLATLYVGVGYPDKWIDYSGLEVVRGDLMGNVERSTRFEYRRQLAKLNQPVDDTEWWMTPQTVNAVNLPLQNGLNFPAAVLVPPFFDPAATPAVNYGAIGATIGHEISHSFDDQGALFDAHGKLDNWWTKADFAHFEASGAQLAAQFDKYRPFPDLAVNGKQTLSENIADVAGLSATHDAWLRSLGGKPAPEAQGFSGEQQFFLSYGQSWRSKTREPALRQQIITDGHAPERYRADTARNLDAWYPAYDVKPGQALYLAPKDRVRVW
jgi:putative endopeptidase